MFRRTGKIILCRHGQSIWNKENKFTGWSDISLDNVGINQSYQVFHKLKNNNLIPDYIYTSKLKRSIHTSLIIRNNFNSSPKLKTRFELNERNYGELEGVNRNDAKLKYGEENIKNIREKLNYLPNFRNNIPLLDNISYNFNKYGESNNMVKKRVDLLWKDDLNYMIDNNLILIVSHKNVLRLLMKKFENIDDIGFEKLDINNACPILYDFDNNYKLVL